MLAERLPTLVAERFPDVHICHRGEVVTPYKDEAREHEAAVQRHLAEGPLAGPRPFHRKCGPTYLSC